MYPSHTTRTHITVRVNAVPSTQKADHQKQQESLDCISIFMIIEQQEQSSSDSRHDEKSSNSRDTSVESSVQDSIESRERAAGEENLKLTFNDASIRAAFVRKVFAIITIMLIVNVVLVIPVLFIEQLRMFIVKHGWIQSVAVLVFLVTYFSSICCSPVARRFPLNIMMISVFTFSAGALLTALCASVPPYTVALALTTTATTCFAVIIFASQTTYDVTSCTFVIFAIAVAAFSFGTILIIASMFLRIHAFHTVISAVFCIVFIIHLALEIQMIIGGHRHDISPEEYIFAALMLFVDIYEIFINILNLLNTSD